MQKGDLTGLGILGGVIVLFGALFLLAPRQPATKIEYRPVEVAGSALMLKEIVRDEAAIHMKATVGKAGFVTLHQAMGAAPGPVLAVSAVLAPGTYEDIALPVEGSLMAGDIYYSLMFVDDGDGVFEPGIDLPVQVDGAVIKVAIEV